MIISKIRKILYCILGLLFMTSTMLGASVIADVTPNVPANLALGKSYTKSIQPSGGYPDAGNESTDGILAGEDYSDGKSYGYQVSTGETKSVDVLVDLENTSTIDDIKIHKWEGSLGYGADEVTVYSSEDGFNYQTIGSSSTPVGLWYDILISSTSARYVKVNFTKYNDGSSGHDWLFIDEIEIYGQPPVEKANLASGKYYSKSIQPSSSYPDTDRESTDGILAGEDYSDGKSYGYQVSTGETKSVDVIIDLENTSTIDDIKIHKWEGSLGYGADEVTVYSSEDGFNYQTIGSSSTPVCLWYDILISSTSARYVKVNFTKYNDGSSGHDWLFIDEIQVYGEGAVVPPTTITSITSVYATVYAGSTYTMPTTVIATMSDGSTSEVAVTWSPSQIDTSTPGLKTATGTVVGYSGTVLLEVQVNAVNSSNLALGKSYTKSIQPSGGYPDAGNESTDGILAGGDYSDGKSYGYQVSTGETKSVDVLVNLENISTIDNITIHKWEGPLGYGADEITVYSSEDGVNYQTIGSSSTPVGLWYDILISSTSTRYIKVNFTKYNDGSSGHDWLFIDEIEIYGQPPVEKANLAAGKYYSKSIQPSSSYPDTNRESTDGILAGEDYSDGKSYGYQVLTGETKSVDVLLDLENTSTIDNIKIHKWEGPLGYGADEITVYSSEDGVNYQTIGSSSTPVGLWYDILISSTSAHYVKVNFTKYNDGSSGHDWLFVDEIRVIGTAGATGAPGVPSIPANLTATMTGERVDLSWDAVADTEGGIEMDNLLGDIGNLEMHYQEYINNRTLTNADTGASLFIDSPGMLIKTIDGKKCVDGWFSDYEWPNIPRVDILRFPTIDGHKYLVYVQAKGALTLFRINPANGELTETMEINSPDDWIALNYVAQGDGNEMIMGYRAGYVTEDIGYFRDVVVIDVSAAGDGSLSDEEIKAKYGALRYAGSHTITATQYDLEIDGTVVDAGMKTSYMHDNIIPNSAHAYRVRAKNIGGVGEWSEPVTVGNAEAPSVPANLAATMTGNQVDLSWDAVADTEGGIEMDNLLGDIGNLEMHYQEYINNRTLTNADTGASLFIDSPGMLIKTIDGKKCVDGWFSDYEWPNIPRVDILRFPTIDGHKYLVYVQAKGALTLFRINPANGELTETMEINSPDDWTAINYVAQGDGNEMIMGYRAGYVTEDIGYFRDVAVIDVSAAGDGSLSDEEIKAKYGALRYAGSHTITATQYDLEIDGTVVDAGMKTSYTHDNIIPNSAHAYRVRAKNIGGIGEWSNPVDLGQVTKAYYYDEGSRLIKIENGSDTINFEYDSSGNLLRRWRGI